MTDIVARLQAVTAQDCLNDFTAVVELIGQAVTHIEGMEGERFMERWGDALKLGEAQGEIDRLKLMIEVKASPDGEGQHLDAIDQAVLDAVSVLDLVGVPSEEEDPEAWNEAFERVSHCSTCTVREVMNVVWPPIESYINWLKSRIPNPD